jgi:hypothetical protein
LPAPCIIAGNDICPLFPFEFRALFWLSSLIYVQVPMLQAVSPLFTPNSSVGRVLPCCKPPLPLHVLDPVGQSDERSACFNLVAEPNPKSWTIVRGQQPKHKPTPVPPKIKIDTS